MMARLMTIALCLSLTVTPVFASPCNDSASWSKTVHEENSITASVLYLPYLVLMVPVRIIDAIINPPQDVDLVTEWDAATGNTKNIETYAAVGSDLRDDHPVSIEYIVSNGLKAIGTPMDLPLFTGASGTLSNQVECATCHDVHDGGADMFLRVDDNNSDICIYCHNK